MPQTNLHIGYAIAVVTALGVGAILNAWSTDPQIVYVQKVIEVEPARNYYELNGGGVPLLGQLYFRTCSGKEVRINDATKFAIEANPSEARCPERKP